MGLSEIVECLTGADVHSPDATDQSLLITLVTTPGTHGSRVIAIMFATRDIRNTMLSGFRYAIVFVHDDAEPEWWTMICQTRSRHDTYFS